MWLENVLKKQNTFLRDKPDWPLAALQSGTNNYTVILKRNGGVKMVKHYFLFFGELSARWEQEGMTVWLLLCCCLWCYVQVTHFNLIIMSIVFIMFQRFVLNYFSSVQINDELNTFSYSLWMFSLLHDGSNLRDTGTTKTMQWNAKHGLLNTCELILVYRYFICNKESIFLVQKA